MGKFQLAKDFFLDLIFPRFCLGCKKELSVKQVSHLCETCFNSIYINPATQCFVCHKRILDGKICSPCRSKTNLTGFLAAGRYEDRILRETIHYLKYNFLESLKLPLAEIAKHFIRKNKLEYIFENAILVPTPLTRRRHAQRGFNQAELIAKELRKIFDCNIESGLIKRNNFQKAQADISNWQERKANISGAFSVGNQQKIKELAQKKTKFILIDDVSTSGATLEECAKTLKAAGAKEVWGFVIARG